MHRKIKSIQILQVYHRTINVKLITHPHDNFDTSTNLSGHIKDISSVVFCSADTSLEDASFILPSLLTFLSTLCQAHVQIPTPQIRAMQKVSRSLFQAAVNQKCTCIFHSAKNQFYRCSFQTGMCKLNLQTR